jgi:uncharacterized protein YndB with AHSA1/START domain
MAERTRGYAQRIDIRIDIDSVWNALIDPATVSRWYAPATRIDARERGIYTVNLEPTLALEANIDVFVPPRRLRLIYMPFPGMPDDGAVIVEDFLLDRDDAAAREAGVSAVTVLRLLGSGIPDSAAWNRVYMRLRTGWERALPRLKVLLERPPAGREGPKFRPLTGY